MNDRTFQDSVSSELAQSVAARKRDLEKSLRDRDDELNDDLETLTGNHFGHILNLSCGCQFTIGGQEWSTWNMKHNYTGRLKECGQHL